MVASSRPWAGFTTTFLKIQYGMRGVLNRTERLPPQGASATVTFPLAAKDTSIWGAAAGDWQPVRRSHCLNIQLPLNCVALAFGLPAGGGFCESSAGCDAAQVAGKFVAKVGASSRDIRLHAEFSK